MGFIQIKVGFNMKIIMVRILLIIASMGIVTLPQAETTPKLKLMTEIYPPFQNKNDERMFGISIDIVKAIQKLINNSDEIKIYPWPRGVKILNSKPNSALFSMVRTAERESLYKWVGPLTSTQMVFYKKKGANITINSLEDAKKVSKVGVTRNVANYDVLIANGFTNLEIVSDGTDDRNIQKLVDGEIILWPTLKKSGMYIARLVGLAHEIELVPNILLLSDDLYIAFNKETSDEIISQWQSAFDKLHEQGKVDAIIKNYQ